MAPPKKLIKMSHTESQAKYRNKFLLLSPRSQKVRKEKENEARRKNYQKKKENGEFISILFYLGLIWAMASVDLLIFADHSSSIKTFLFYDINLLEIKVISCKRLMMKRLMITSDSFCHLILEYF